MAGNGTSSGQNSCRRNPDLSEQRGEHMKQEGTVSTKTVRRSAVVILLVFLVFAALLLKILLYETVDYEKYQSKVLNQMTTETTVKAERGVIYDRNGAVLAGNVTTYRVFISPSAIASAEKDQDPTSSASISRTIAEHLSVILHVSYENVLKQTEYTKYLDRTIAKNVDEETADQVLAFISEYGYGNLVFLQASSSRYYPHDSLACHVLGFTGTDGGSLGLELKYDELLSGTDGRYIVARDAQGNEMPYDYEEYIEAENGKNVVTTLDVYVQSIMEEILKTVYTETGSSRVSGIVMDVNNGDILALANYPDFDLNHPGVLNEEMTAKLTALGLDPDSDEYYSKKVEYMMEMWRNEAVSDSYTPGSTFKIITASVALEENLVKLSDSVCCGGYLTIAGQKIHCHKVTGHGPLSFAEGIQQSCNVWLMSLSQKFGLTQSLFYKYYQTFGYREKTGIDLPGEGGSTFWDLDSFMKSPLDLPIASFGQNFTVTAIQQITAVAAVANGGNLVTPHLLKEVLDSDGNVLETYQTEIKRQVVSSEVCATMAKILEEGVSGNGGAKNAYVAGYRVAAKTGTAEKEPKNQNKYVCSCVAFAPADVPQYAIIIIADEPTGFGYQYGSTAAAPFVSDALEQILPYLGIEAVYNETEMARRKVTISNFTTWSVSLASAYAENMGIAYEIVGDGKYITSQIPAAGAQVEAGSAKVILYTGGEKPENTVRVPDVKGMTAVAASQTLINAGLNIRITGNTGENVLLQSVAPGTMVSPGTLVTIMFGSPDGDEDLSGLPD